MKALKLIFSLPVHAYRYLWDHRNQSLRSWLVDEFVGGANGLGNPSVDGFFFDDGWSTKVRRRNSLQT